MDLRQQIATEVHLAQPAHYGCSHCTRTADAVWAVVQPALDAKDAEIARLKDEILRLSERLRLRLEQSEATVERVKKLAEGWLADGPADAKILAQRTIAALAQPDQEGTP
jgi:hypothetical protein